jgi:hypothetical protein
VTTWVVRHGDDLYDVDKDVRFVEANDDVNDAIDDAYRSKYRRYPASTVDPMVTPEVRGTTLKLVPR